MLTKLSSPEKQRVREVGCKNDCRKNAEQKCIVCEYLGYLEMWAQKLSEYWKNKNRLSEWKGISIAQMELSEFWCDSLKYSRSNLYGTWKIWRMWFMFWFYKVAVSALPGQGEAKLGGSEVMVIQATMIYMSFGNAGRQTDNNIMKPFGEKLLEITGSYDLIAQNTNNEKEELDEVHHVLTERASIMAK